MTRQHSRNLGCMIAAVLLCGSILPDANAQETKSLADVYKESISAFTSGKFEDAVAGLKQVAEKAAPDAPQLEAVYYSLGAAYFNLKDYSNAAATFETLLKKFPNSNRAGEVRFAMAQAQFQNDDLDAAKATLKTLETDPKYREDSLHLQSVIAKKTGDTAGSIALLEKLIQPGITTGQSAGVAIELAAQYIQAGDTEKAAKLIDRLQGNLVVVENVVDLNSLTLSLGDKLLSQGKYDEALARFRKVRLSDEVVQSQEAQIAAMEKKVAANVARIQKEPDHMMSILAANDQLRARIESTRKLLEEFKKTPPILGALYLRMARCFEPKEEPWNAIVVYDELLAHSTVATEREAALYGLASTYALVGQAAEAQAACELYLKEFPAGPNAPGISYLRAEMALRQKKYEEAEGMFTGLLESDPKGTLAQQIRILLGNSRFSQGDYEAAISQYKKYLKQFPKGELVEEANYRITLALLFSEKYEDAVRSLRLYLEKNPKGSFVPDAKYRLAVCDYAAQDYPAVIKACKTWQKTYPGDPQNAEVSSLLGDAYTATGDTGEAIKSYQAACREHDATDEVLNYSIFEAAKLLQRESRWDDISEMFETFVKDRPDHPTVPSALFWIGKAKAREGKIEEARQFLASTATKYIDDPTREAVEQMLTQLAQLCAKPAAPAENGPAAKAPQTPDKELEKLLSAANNSPIRKARILFAKSEVARLRKDPESQRKLIAQIAAVTKLDDLSPALLGLCGDQLLHDGQIDKAAKFYTYLMDYYPKSSVVDFAYAGLGEIALEKGESRRALRTFSDGLDKLAPVTKLRDMTLGKAKALLALNRYEEAQKLFERVASTREWRGEATAISLFSLGEILWRQEKWAEANAFFQRLFVAYGKFPVWVARAYVKSAECFVKLGKTQEAIDTLKEMLRDERLAGLPEMRIAAASLQKLSPQ